MLATLRFPSGLCLTDFIRDYWQQKPLLLPQAIDPDLLQFPADELAGLACEDDIESRLIEQLGEQQWQLTHGPLDEEQFDQLADSHWTLLVQDVDKYVPEVADLLDLFDFLPDWRIDDIMISYAVDQGGVGPHIDNYDVFLIQAQGQRRWRLSDRIYQDKDLLPGCPLRVLQQFDTDLDLLLKPGDVLYLPPRLAHWGVAQGECMTWSLGMRCPNQTELMDAWMSYRNEHLTPRHFKDHLASQQTSSAISSTDIIHARELMQELLTADSALFADWFGRYVTEPKAGFEIEPLDHQIDGCWLQQRLDAGAELKRHPWARFAGQFNDTPGLFSQGRFYPAAHAEWVTLVCQHRHLRSSLLSATPKSDDFRDWLAKLYQQGLLIFDLEG